ncbi:MAG: transposase [Flavobacteriaceae bacterium]|nr:transposase [Flavobacteriaceae bacterium]
MAPRSLEELHHGSIDEKSYQRRHHDTTVVSDSGNRPCREDLKAIFQAPDIIPAKERLKSWFDQVKTTGIQEVMKVAQTFQRHLDGIIHALTFKPSHARAERIHGEIQPMKTVARGYRKFENYRSAVLFFCAG